MGIPVAVEITESDLRRQTGNLFCCQARSTSQTSKKCSSGKNALGWAQNTFRLLLRRQRSQRARPSAQLPVSPSGGYRCRFRNCGPPAVKHGTAGGRAPPPEVRFHKSSLCQPAVTRDHRKQSAPGSRRARSVSRSVRIEGLDLHPHKDEREKKDEVDVKTSLSCLINGWWRRGSEFYKSRMSEWYCGGVGHCFYVSGLLRYRRRTGMQYPRGKW